MNTKPLYGYRFEYQIVGYSFRYQELKKVSKCIPNRYAGEQIGHIRSAETSIKKCRLALSCYAVKIKEVFFNIISNFFLIVKCTVVYTHLREFNFQPSLRAYGKF